MQTQQYKICWGWNCSARVVDLKERSPAEAKKVIAHANKEYLVWCEDQHLPSEFEGFVAALVDKWGFELAKEPINVLVMTYN